MTANQIAYGNLVETSRHNLAFEKETERHNKEQEAIGWQQAAASMLGAQAAMSQAEAAHRMVDVNILNAQAAMRHADAAIIGANAQMYSAAAMNRHYVRSDAIQAEYYSGLIGVQTRANAIQEARVFGQNVQSIGSTLISGVDSFLNYRQQNETRRHNQMTEVIGFLNVGETGRHNRADEAIRESMAGGSMARDYTQAFRNVVGGVVDGANFVSQIIGGKRR